MAETAGERVGAKDLLGDLARLLPEFGPPLGLLCSTLLIPLLEGQRALLRSYQKALSDPSFRQAEENHVRALTKVLMEAWLDLSRAQRENQERVNAMRSTLITTYLEALDKTMSRLVGPEK